MKFDSSNDERSSRRDRRPPPNYFTRSMQVRLLTSVFAFMLVLVLMFEARKPENWKWMWAGVDTSSEAEEELEPIDTRLPPAERRPADEIGTVYANDPPGTSIADEVSAEADDADALHRVEIDAWRGIWRRLDRDQRIVLQRVLRASRRRTAFDTNDSATWSDTYEQIEQSLARYLETANEAVLVSGEEVPADQKRQLLNVLRRVEVDWKESRGNALQAVLEERAWTELERETLSKLQATLDELALMEIRDDMVSRPAEQYAWFRLLESLIEQDEQHLKTQSLGEASFVQLFRQPNEYRGKVVMVRGRVESACKVSAPKNDVGIQTYYMLWLRPLDSSGSPIVAYTLKLPLGFPAIGEELTPIREDVTLTAYFFKRWAYRAKDGIRTAPLLLAKVPVWHPEPAGRTTTLPSPGVALIAVMFVALLAFRIARWAYSASNALPSKRRTAAANSPNAAQFEALRHERVHPPIDEALRELSDQDET